MKCDFKGSYCVKFKNDIKIEKGKNYIIFYDTINNFADIKEVVGFDGDKPIFKEGCKE